MELTVITAANCHHSSLCEVLCLRFVWLVLNSACTATRFSPPLLTPSKNAGVGQNITGRRQIPTDQRDIPHSMSYCPKVKTGRKKRKGKLWHTIVCPETLLPRKRLDICWPIGNNEFITYFVFLAGGTFVFSVKLLSTQSVSLLTFFLLSHCPRGERSCEWMGGWVFGS